MTVLKEGAALAEMGYVMGWMTVVFMAVMIVWAIYIFSPSQTENMRKNANMPLED